VAYAVRTSSGNGKYIVFLAEDCGANDPQSRASTVDVDCHWKCRRHAATRDLASSPGNRPVSRTRRV